MCITCVNLHVHTHIYIYICIASTQAHLSLSLSIYIYIYIYIYVCVCVYIYIYIYVCMHVCMYMYVCIYIYTSVLPSIPSTMEFSCTAVSLNLQKFGIRLDGLQRLVDMDRQSAFSMIFESLRKYKFHRRLRFQDLTSARTGRSLGFVLFDDGVFRHRRLHELAEVLDLFCRIERVNCIRRVRRTFDVFDTFDAPHYSNIVFDDGVFRHRRLHELAEVYNWFCRIARVNCT